MSLHLRSAMPPLMQLGVNKIEADEVIAEVRYLDQERLNEEVLHGFSTDIIRKY